MIAIAGITPASHGMMKIELEIMIELQVFNPSAVVKFTTALGNHDVNGPALLSCSTSVLVTRRARGLYIFTQAGRSQPAFIIIMTMKLVSVPVSRRRDEYVLGMYWPTRLVRTFLSLNSEGPGFKF
jgi:hypothetical protein